MKYKKYKPIIIKNQKWNSDQENCFFISKILFDKIYLIKEIFNIFRFRKFINVVSSKILNNVIKKMIKNNLLVLYCAQSLNFMINVDFQEFFNRKIYQKYFIFPQLKLFQLQKKKKNSLEEESFFNLKFRKKKKCFDFS